MTLKRLQFNTIFGYIDYSYFNKLNSYKNGLLVIHGAIVYREYRGTGKFKEMLKMLFSFFPEGTIVQGAIITKKLTSMFERIGFKRVKKIEYWGSPSNCNLVQGIITKDIIDLI